MPFPEQVSPSWNACLAPAFFAVLPARCLFILPFSINSDSAFSARITALSHISLLILVVYVVPFAYDGTRDSVRTVRNKQIPRTGFLHFVFCDFLGINIFMRRTFPAVFCRHQRLGMTLMVMLPVAIVLRNLFSGSCRLACQILGTRHAVFLMTQHFRRTPLPCVLSTDQVWRAAAVHIPAISVFFCILFCTPHSGKAQVYVASAWVHSERQAEQLEQDLVHSRLPPCWHHIECCISGFRQMHFIRTYREQGACCRNIPQGCRRTRREQMLIASAPAAMGYSGAWAGRWR